MRRGGSGGRRDDTDATPRRGEVWLTSRPDAAQSSSDSLTVALCYPESYALGMSNLGYQAALRSFAEAPGAHCERAFLQVDPAPAGSGPARGPDLSGAESDVGETGVRDPRSLETGTPLRDFDVIAFSVSFEADFLGLARMLSAAGVPLRSAERTEADPIVIMGGVCALLNAEPVADMVDAVALGDAGGLVPPLVESLRASGNSERRRRLVLLSGIPGIYVPSLYDVARRADGTVGGFRPAEGAPLPVRAVWSPRRAPAGTCVLSPDAFFGNAYLAEVSSGCRRGCRFCAAGHVYRPVLFHAVDDIMSGVRDAASHTGKIGLVSAALADHPGATELLRALNELGVEVTISSVHADRVDGELAALLRSVGVRTVTLAPETGTERLRRLIGKPVGDERLILAASELAAAGGESLKLYFMVGLPGETEEDLEAIPRLARRISAEFVAGRGEARVSVGVSAFVPKPRTPFQWLPMAGEREIRDKLSSVRRSLSQRPRIEFTSVGPREARREGVLARGGRELARVLELAAVSAVPWKAALRRAGVNEGAIIDRARPDDEVMPWDLVEVGVPKDRLLASLREARRLMAG